MSTFIVIRRQVVELLRYLWIAVAGTGINIAVFAALRNGLGVDLFWSRAIGYGTGVLLGFILSRSFSFKNRTSTGPKSESVKYIFVTMCAFAVTSLFQYLIQNSLTWFFAQAPNIHAELIKVNQVTGQKWINRELVGTIGGIGVGFFVNFFGHKFLTFRRTNVLERLRIKRSKI